MIVIDASVANKLFLKTEEGFTQVKKIFDNHVKNVNEIVVPNLLFLEVANTLATKTAVPINLTVKALKKLNKYNLGVNFPTINNIVEAASLAVEHRVSVYDAIYLVLALEKKCDLITADEKFVEQVRLPFVKKLSSIT